MSKASRTVIPCLFVLSFFLAACNQEPGGAASQPHETLVADSAMPEPAAPQALHVTDFRIGRYVEPGTFAVGGVGTRFKQSDRLFAVVHLEGVGHDGSATVRVLDASGQSVAEQAQALKANGPMRVNFSLTPGSGLLSPGSYTAEAVLDGRVMASREIVIEASPEPES